MNLGVDIAAPAVAWTIWNVAVATTVPRLPTRRQRPPAATASRRGRLAVRRWQHLLPDAGALVPGSSTKRRLPGRDRVSLERHAVELRRGELVHWLSLVAVPLLALWWPAVVVVPMIVVGVLVNAPCIVSLRATRRRIDELLVRRAARQATKPD